MLMGIFVSTGCPDTSPHKISCCSRLFPDHFPFFPDHTTYYLMLFWILQTWKFNHLNELIKNPTTGQNIEHIRSMPQSFIGKCVSTTFGIECHLFADSFFDFYFIVCTQWKSPDLSLTFLTIQAFPWLFPDVCLVWNTPNFSLTAGHPVGI